MSVLLCTRVGILRLRLSFAFRRSSIVAQDSKLADRHGHSRSLFRARFGRDQAGEAVIDDELSVVFAAVFDEAVG